MTEFKVWKIIVDWIEDNGGKVIAGCPPGSSVYDYRKFCIIDPVSGKRDEPDILLIWNDEIFFIECKSTLAAIKSGGKKRNIKENDIQKLKRIRSLFEMHRYDKQMFDNYGIKVDNNTKLKIGIGFASPHKEIMPIDGVTQFIVNDSGELKIVD